MKNLVVVISLLIFVGCGGGGSNTISTKCNQKLGHQELDGIWNVYYNTMNGKIIKDEVNDIWQFQCTNNKIYALPTNNDYSRVDQKTLAGTYNYISSKNIKLNGENGTASITYTSKDDTAGNCIYVQETFDNENDTQIWCKQNDYSNKKLLNEIVIGKWSEYLYNTDGTIKKSAIREWYFNKDGSCEFVIPSFSRERIKGFSWNINASILEIYDITDNNIFYYSPNGYYSEEGKSIKM